MDSILHLYDPVNTSLHQTTWISLFLLVLALLGIFYNQKRKVSYAQRNYRQLLTLLLSFVVLMAFVAAVFSVLTSKRIGPVKVYADRIETVEATIPAAKINKAYIFLDTPQSNYGLQTSSDTTKLLILEEVDGRTHVFSEYNYDVEQMMREMRAWLKTETGIKSK